MRSDITTLNISLPKKLRARLERKLKRDDYASASEYVRELIRKDLLAHAIEQVDQLLLEGLNSGPGRPADENFWREVGAAAIAKPRRRRA
jgi:antitoxin ParD1/3/4